MTAPLGETPANAPAPAAPSQQQQQQQKKEAPFVAVALATWFGAGLAPRAPGTVGSLASLVLWAPLVLLETAWWVRAIAALVVFVTGVIASAAIVRARGKEDPQLVVIDEVAGMGITLTFAAHGAWSLALGFVLFRIFDIAKPWPVSLADRNVKGGFGVMLDDALAGAYALGGLVLVERFVLPAFLPTEVLP